MTLTACADLSRPNTLKVSRDPTAMENQMEIAPDNMVRVPGADGKPINVPRLHPPGTPNAGKPVMPGEKVERSTRPAPTAAPSASPATR